MGNSAGKPVVFTDEGELTSGPWDDRLMPYQKSPSTCHSRLV